jgi:hypothetical protein
VVRILLRVVDVWRYGGLCTFIWKSQMWLSIEKLICKAPSSIYHIYKTLSFNLVTFVCATVEAKDIRQPVMDFG